MYRLGVLRYLLLQLPAGFREYISMESGTEDNEVDPLRGGVSAVNSAPVEAPADPLKGGLVGVDAGISPFPVQFDLRTPEPVQERALIFSSEDRLVDQVMDRVHEEHLETRYEVLADQVFGVERRLDHIMAAIQALGGRAESDIGNAARHEPRKDTRYRKWNRDEEKPEAMHGVKPVSLPVKNFVEFFSASDGTEFVGNGVFAQGKLFTLAHVWDMSRSFKVNGELLLTDSVSVKRRPLPDLKDAVVTGTVKKAVPGMNKVKLAPDSADVGDAVFGQPLLDGVGHFTSGQITVRSADSGRKKTYVASTSTEPGCSGAPFFVVGGGSGQVMLLGLHYGDCGTGNKIIGLDSSDFQ
jgi:hypothetical protein